MKLTFDIKELKLKHSWGISRGVWHVKQNVFVRLEKDGITGLGEAAPNIRYDETPESTVGFIEKAKPLLENSDPEQFYDLGKEIQALAAGQTAAKAALDIALLDWNTKRAGFPMYRYLGLQKAKAPVTSFSIGIDSAEIIRQKIQEADEYPLLKIKLGQHNDEEIIDTVRAVTDKPLRIDANEGWTTKEEALAKIHWLQTQNVEFIEQPMPADMLSETAWVRERVDLPLIADESVKGARDIPQLATAFDGINIKIMKSGGLQEALRMIWLAKAMEMKIMLGCMVESSIAISAAAAISPLADYADLDGNLLISNDPYTGAAVENGVLILNDLPGIGVTTR